MKTLKVFLKALTIGLTLAALTACDVKLTGGDTTSPNTTLSDITGTWTSNCYSIGTAYVIQTMVITNSSYQESPVIYSDSACKKKISQPAGGTGSFVQQGADAVLNNAIDVQITYQDQNNQTQTGYTIVLPQGGNLYFPAQFAAGSSPQSRPTSVDYSVVFSRATSLQ